MDAFEAAKRQERVTFAWNFQVERAPISDLHESRQDGWPVDFSITRGAMLIAGAVIVGDMGSEQPASELADKGGRIEAGEMGVRGVQGQADCWVVNGHQKRRHLFRRCRPGPKQIFESDLDVSFPGGISQPAEGLPVRGEQAFFFGWGRVFVSSAGMDHNDLNSQTRGDLDMPMEAPDILRALLRIGMGHIGVQQRMGLGGGNTKGSQGISRGLNCPLGVGGVLQFDEVFRRDFDDGTAQCVDFFQRVNEREIGEEGGPEGRIQNQAVCWGSVTRW